MKTGWIDLPTSYGVNYEFDADAGLLYVALRKDKQIAQYDLETGTLLDPLELGYQVGGLSLTADGQTLYAAKFLPNYVNGGLYDDVSGQSIFAIDTATGTSERFSHQVTGLERGVSDLAVASNGKVLSVSEPDTFSSGYMALWRLNPETGKFNRLKGDNSLIASSSHIMESESGDHILVIEGFSSATMRIYSAAENKLIGTIENFDYGFQPGNVTDSVDISSAAELIAAEAYKGRILGFDGTIKANLSGYGLDSYAFTTDGTMLFGYDAKTHRVFGFDTDTWALEKAYLLDMFLDGVDQNFRLTNLDSDTAGVLFFEDVGTGELAVLDLAEAAQTRFFTDDSETIIGGAGADVLDGEGGDDLIKGNKGSDGLFGRSGDDTLIGNLGEDYLRGNIGDDILKGGAGRDTLFGDRGSDDLFGGSHSDQLFGGDGNDTLNGDEGDDRLRGGTGDDKLRGDDGDDWLVGDRGNDTMQGGDGADSLIGSWDDDFLLGNAGDDKLFGGGGYDTLGGGTGNDLLKGGAGEDTLSGGADDDSVFGDAGEDLLRGNGGDDMLDGGRNADILLGGNGADTLLGGGESDELDGGKHADTLKGQAGSDLIFGGAGADSLFGGNGRDGLIGDGGDDALYGGDGIDILIGWTGDDDLTGGAGRDLFVFAPRNGHDTIHDFQGGFDVMTFQNQAGVQMFDDFDEVKALATDIGSDMKIMISADQSVLIKDFSRAEFHEADVYFGFI